MIHPLPRRPAAVIFDMDGILFDTEALYREALFAVSTEQQYAMTDAVFEQMVGCPWPTNRAFLLQHFGAAYPVDMIRDSAHARLREMTGAIQFLKAGVIELLDALEEWQLPHAIATSAAVGSVQRNLGHHGLTKRFPHIIAHGDYAAGKPAPDPFLTAAARLGVAPELCVALEDSHNGVRSAAAAGMMTIMVPDLLAPTYEMHRLCAHIADDLHAARDVIGAALHSR